LHLKAIYGDGELSETATCKNYLQVRIEGKRKVSRNLSHYSLPAILAVGYLDTLREMQKKLEGGGGGNE